MADPPELDLRATFPALALVADARPAERPDIEPLTFPDRREPRRDILASPLQNRAPASPTW